MAKSEQLSTNDLTASDYPWISVPIDGVPANPMEHAYKAGQFIERHDNFLRDDSKTELINLGAGPRTEVPDVSIQQFEDNEGTFGLFVAIEPADLDLYRHLLPINYSMPDTPVVSLANLDYNHPNPVTRYREGMVMLKAIGADGEEQWYVHSMPVESWLMQVMGHSWGFRKQLYDMTVTAEKTTVMMKNGELYMSLELTSFEWDKDAKAIIPNGGNGGCNNFSVVWPSDPSMVVRFGSNGEPHILDENRKMVKITVNPDVDWAGLLPESSIAPGRYLRYVGSGADSFVKKVR